MSLYVASQVLVLGQTHVSTFSSSEPAEPDSKSSEKISAVAA